MTGPAAGGLFLAVQVVTHHSGGDVGTRFFVEGNEVNGAAIEFFEPLGLVDTLFTLRSSCFRKAVC